MKTALTWTPRAIALAYGVFISVFALDAFEGTHSLAEKAVALAMHLVPTLLVFAALAVAWRWKLLGGVLFLLIASLLFRMEVSHSRVYFIIVAPPAIAGILFIVNSRYPKSAAGG